MRGSARARAGRASSRVVSLAAALLAVGAAGCPAGSADAPEPEPPSRPAAVDDGPERPPVAVEDIAGTERPVSPPPPGPAGPAGPAGPVRIPEPEDGRSQIDLLPERRIAVGAAEVTVWVADTDPTRRLGLMHVRAMEEERGMLFVFPRAGRRSFWMQNTYIPLSLAYITADGVVDQILDMEPHSLDSHPSRGSVKFVLEVNQGWFERHGVGVGDRVAGLAGLIGR